MHFLAGKSNLGRWFGGSPVRVHGLRLSGQISRKIRQRRSLCLRRSHLWTQTNQQTGREESLPLLGWPVQCIAASGRARLHSSFFRSIKIKLRNTSLLFPLTLSNIAALRAPACVKTRSLEEETHTSVFSCINIVSRKSHGPTSYRYELQPLHIHGICVPLCVCVYRDR